MRYGLEEVGWTNACSLRGLEDPRGLMIRFDVVAIASG
jgi:hypothetical protein